MKTLLLSPVRSDNFYYPQLGLGYIANYCRNNDYNVAVLDCAKEGYTYSDLESFIKNNEFQVIGITVFTFTAREVKKTIEIIKGHRSDTVVVVGGHLISAIPEQTFKYFTLADFGIAGEGEIAFCKFLKALEGKQSYHNVPGLIYKEKGKVMVNHPVIVEDIDQFGFPAWDLLNPPDYFKVFSSYKKTAPMVFSRGCPFKCTFCTASLIGGKKFRMRSIPHIIEEIKFLQETYGVNTIAIQTEGLGSSKNFMKDFCEEITKNNIEIELTIPPGIRLSMLNEDLLRYMRKAGFSKMITVGIESGSDRILKLMKKGITTDQVRKKIDMLNRCGFKPTGNFIIGYPTETKEEILKTIDFSLQLNIWQAAYHPFIPIPGAEITKSLMESGELSEDFNFMDITTVDNPVYAPKGLTIDEIKQIHRESILRFFLRPKIIIFLLSDIDRFLFAVKKFKGIISEIYKKNVIMFFNVLRKFKIKSYGR